MPKAGKVSTHRHDILLKPLGEEILRREMLRRGESASATIRAILAEWELLAGVVRAAKVRHDLRRTMNAMGLACEAAAVTNGKERDDHIDGIRRSREEALSLIPQITQA